MNAFCPNLSNKQVKKEFDELVGIFGEDVAYFLWDKNNGYSLDRAPNGAPSQLFSTLLDYYEGDRDKTFIIKSKVYFRPFKDWFGDWQSEDKTNVSKVVDENGEPKIVWHGGAQDILTFKKLQYESYYENKKTGEKIPADSMNTIFFSSNKYVGISYGVLFGYNYFQNLQGLVNSLLDTTSEGRLGISKDIFKPEGDRKTILDEFLYTLDLLSEFNPRIIKFKQYFLNLRKENKHMGEREVKEFRKILLLIRKELDKIDSHVVNETDYERILHMSLEILNRYNNEKGMQALMSGEIPKEILQEWNMYKQIEKDRERLGLTKLLNYEKVYLFFNRSILNRTGLKYDGNKLAFLTDDYSDPAVVDMTKEQLKNFINKSIAEVKNEQNTIKNDNLYNEVKSKAQLYPTFLNLRNPFVHDYGGTHFGQGYKQNEKLPFGYVAARQVRKAMQDGNDGVIYKNIYDPYLADNYGVFNSNQIKHIENYGYFSNRDNIYLNKAKPNNNLGFEFHQYMYNNGYLNKYSIPTPKLLKMVSVNAYKTKQQRVLVVDYIRKMVINRNLNFNAEDIYYDGRDGRITYRDSSYVKDSKLAKELFKNSYRQFGTGYTTVTGSQMVQNLIDRAGKNKMMSGICELLRKAIDEVNCEVCLLDGNTFNRKISSLGITDPTASYYDSETNTIYVNNDAVFIDTSQVSKHKADSSILHELIHAVTVNTLKHSQSLIDEINGIIDNVKQILLANGYTEQEIHDIYGLSGPAEFLAQLSDYSFCKLLSQVKIKTGNKLKSAFLYVKNLLKTIYNRIKKQLGLTSNVEDTELAHAFEILYRAAYPHIFNEELQDVSTFDYTIFRQQAYDKNIDEERQKHISELNDKIEDLFNQLYNLYNKSAKSQKTERVGKMQDAVYQEINNLKNLRDVEEIKAAIDFGLKQLGVDQLIKEDEDQNELQGNNQNQTVLQFLNNNKDNISPDDLLNIKTTVLQFYDKLLSNKVLLSEYRIGNNTINVVQDALINTYGETSDKYREYMQKLNVLKNSLESVRAKWNNEVFDMSDKIVDEFIENETQLDSERKEMLKASTKQWLHYNSIRGFFDIPAMLSFLYNFEHNRSSVVRMMFQMISQARQRTTVEALPIQQEIKKAFDKANSVKKLLSVGNWQTMLMEKDANGNFTGNFVSDINQGEYLRRQTEFTKKLNKEMEEKFGYTYVYDTQTGKMYRSDGSGKSMEDEVPESDSNGNPTGDYVGYIYYMLQQEKWKCENANRRYTFKYYSERLSAPYSEQNPNGHGLSPKTLSTYNRIQSNINYYLNKKIDPETGLSHPEELDGYDLQQLDMWRNQLKIAQSFYNADGELKQDEEMQAAIEINMWQNYVNQNIQTLIDREAFEAEAEKIEKTKGKAARAKFEYYNSTYGINPEITNLIYGLRSPIENQNYKQLLLIRSSAKRMVKMDKLYAIDLSNLVNNVQFFIGQHQLEESIESLRRFIKETEPGNYNGIPVVSVPKYIKDSDGNLKYDVDENGNVKTVQQVISLNKKKAPYVDKNGNYVKSEDGDIVESDGTKYLSWYQVIRQRIFQTIKDNGYKLTYYDENGDQLEVSFDTNKMTDDQILQWITDNILTYKRQFHNQDGDYELPQLIDILTIDIPNCRHFVNPKTGKLEESLINIPTGRFRTKSNYDNVSQEDMMMNPDYDIHNPDPIQPKKSIYSNKEAMDAINNDKHVKEYYDLLIELMSKYWNMISGQKYRYVLPQLDADNVAILSRYGFSAKTLPVLMKYLTTINSKDLDQRSYNDYGDVIQITQDVVLPRFTSRLEDPNTVSSDLVYSVAMFIQYAISYINNSAIQGKLEVLRSALHDNRYRKEGGGKRQSEQADQLLTMQLYENLWNNIDDSKSQIVLTKLLRASSRGISKHMLGHNYASMGAGAVSSTIGLFRRAGEGKYYNFKDLIKAISIVFFNMPKMLLSANSGYVNNPVGAAMRRFRISTNVQQSLKNTYMSRIRRNFSENSMMGFSAVDYTINSIILVSFLKTRRFINDTKLKDGDGNEIEIKGGFYTIDELEYKTGSRKLAKSLYKSSHTTMWGAYKYNKNTGMFEVKEQYKKYITPELEAIVGNGVRNRAAVNNGVSTDEDGSIASQNKWFMIVSAMRNFIWQAAQSLYVGGEDFVIPDQDNDVIKENKVIGGKTKQIKVYEKKKLTPDQKYLRGVFNFSTGQFQDDYIRSAYRAIVLALGKVFRLKNSKRNFSKPEIYAIRAFVSLLTAFAIGVFGVIQIDKLAYKTLRGKNLLANYSADIALRGLIQVQSEFDPATLNEFINTTTVYSNGIKELLGPVEYVQNELGFSDKTNDEIIKRGSYKGYRRYQRTLFKFFGPLDNLHTSFTLQGINENYRFYTSMYGGLYKKLGYDLGPVKKPKYSSFSISDMGKMISGPYEEIGKKISEPYKNISKQFDF